VVQEQGKIDQTSFSLEKATDSQKNTCKVKEEYYCFGKEDKDCDSLEK